MKKEIVLGIVFVFFFSAMFAQNGVIKGRVFDDISNEPVAFAYVGLTNNENVGGLTDNDGNFVITGIEPGMYSLTVSFVGYKTVVSRDIQVTNARNAYVEIAMEKEVTELDAVVVTASPFAKKTESPVSLRKIGLQEIEANPGSNRDISKVIQSFPGVGSTPAFRNDIIIRGGGPSESRFYLDGIEIPNLNHFATQGASGGPVGIINADFIAGVDFYSGAFPANYGNALSGVFDFSQISGNQDKLKFRGSVGASEVSAALDGPSGENSTYIFSVRRSYLQFLFSALGLPFLPTFTDYQFKHKTLFDDKSELTIVSIGALDDFALNTDIENPDASQSYILSYLPVNEQWSYAIGANYRTFTENGYHRVVISRNMLDNSAYKYPENDESKSRILDYSSREMENKFRYEYVTRYRGVRVVSGVSSELVTYENTTYQLRNIGNTRYEIDYNTDYNLVKYGMFAQASKRFFNDRFSVSAGLRVDGNDYSSSMANPFDQISPRLSLSYAFSDKFSVNANTGRYYQLPPYTTLGYKNGAGDFVNKDNNLEYIGVNHYIAGFEYRVKKNIQFTVEGFSKYYNQYPYSVNDSISLASKGADYGVLGDEEVLSEAQGHAYGFEVMNRMIDVSGFTVTNSYTYVRSFSNIEGGEKLPTTWDSRHLFTSTLSKKISSTWIVGAKWRFVGGLPYTPYDMEASALRSVWNTRGGPVLDYSQYNQKRFSSFHQLDIRVDRRWFFDTWTFMVYVDIQNVYNYQSEQEDIVIREKNPDGSFVLQNNETEYSLITIDNTSGTVLPTLGIMIEF
ncbi:MAG: TonB-dependent receptor [Bacteroidales bacterium]